MGEIIEKVFEFIDSKDFNSAIQLIKENLAKRDQSFIEDLVPSLNIITSSSIEVTESIMASLLGILNIDDDVIRYSIIISLKNFVIENKELIFPYVEDYLKYGTPKKREGMLLLLEYIAVLDPKSLQPFYKLLVYELGDSVDYIRKKAIDVLKAIGRTNRDEIEVCIFEYLSAKQDEIEKKSVNEILVKDSEKIISSTDEIESLEPQDKLLIDIADKILKKSTGGSSKRADDEDLKNAADIVLKEILNVKALNKSELEKRQLEAQTKALQKKLEEDEENLEREKLQLKEEEKKIKEKLIQQEKEHLEREKRILEKKKELDQVKQELQLKHLEEERKKIIDDENERIQEKIRKFNESDDKEDEFEEID